MTQVDRLGNIERCGMVVTDDGRCARRKAHHGHCAVGGSYAQALDERDDVLQQLRGAVEDAATGRALIDRMFELPRGPEWEQALAELRVWCMDPQQLRGQ